MFTPSVALIGLVALLLVAGVMGQYCTACPPWLACNLGPGGSGVGICNPCAQANATVYMSTGNGASPANALWKVDNFVGSTTSPPAFTPQFLCVIDGVSQVADIAMLYNGGIVVMDSNGNLFYIYPNDIPAPSTAYTTSKCPTTPLGSANTLYTGVGSWSGLANGFTSDSLIATTSTGWVIPLKLALNGVGNAVVIPAPNQSPVQWYCAYNSTTGAGTTNTGGTDITAGPDNMLYRFCAKTVSVDATGTRFTTGPGPTYELAVAFGAYVSNKGSDGDATFMSNAGTFCTSTTVYSVGAYSRASAGNLTGSYVQFYGTGVINSVSTPAVTGDFTTPYMTSLPRALLMGSTVPVPDAVTTFKKEALRVNGAAVKPTCTFT